MKKLFLLVIFAISDKKNSPMRGENFNSRRHRRHVCSHVSLVLNRPTSRARKNLLILTTETLSYLVLLEFLVYFEMDTSKKCFDYVLETRKSQNYKMDSFVATIKSIQTSLEKTNLPAMCLKPMQVKCWHNAINGMDVMAVLPTGYGKSLIFQLLPFMLTVKNTRNIVIIVAPLTSIIIDQVKVLPLRNIIPAVFKSEDISKEVESLFVSTDKTKKIPDEDISTDIEIIKKGEFDLLFAHPEALLSDDGRRLMKSSVFQENVVALVVDEAHCVITW